MAEKQSTSYGNIADNMDVFLNIFRNSATGSNPETMAETESGDNTGLRAIVESIEQFSNILTQSVTDSSSRNLICSPLSAQVVLAMAAYGAGGSNAEQMRSVLGIPSDDELGLSGYHSLIEALNTASGCQLRLANKIYTNIKLEVKPAYRELTATKFLSESEELNFADSSGAAGTINAWCEAQTNNRITNVINPASLNSDTRMILVNAVYFKGNWLKAFPRSRTEIKRFHIDEKTTQRVPTMTLTTGFQIGDLTDLDARFILIPYQGHQLSMIIILPNKINGLKTVLDNLHRVNLNQSIKRMYLNTVSLSLPKFKIESSFNLRGNMEKMGMSEMFEYTANFSGISDVPLFVSGIIQKAFIEVNEEGTEAAAVTATVMSFGSAAGYSPPPVKFTVDRPYYYAIYHHPSAISLFTGIVKQPISR